jgi:hypothetical protein
MWFTDHLPIGMLLTKKRKSLMSIGSWTSLRDCSMLGQLERRFALLADSGQVLVVDISVGEKALPTSQSTKTASQLAGDGLELLQSFIEAVD